MRVMAAFAGGLVVGVIVMAVLLGYLLPSPAARMPSGTYRCYATTGVRGPGFGCDQEATHPMNAHESAQEGQQTVAPAGVASPVPTVDAAALLARRVALLEGLLREALEGLEALVDDPRDPAIRRLLRRMRAALAAGG